MFPKSFLRVAIILPITASFLISSFPIRAVSKSQASITVSGTITGPSGAVSNVWIGIGSPQDWKETNTDSAGSYNITIQTDGQLWFHVRPDVSTRLTQVNLWMSGATASFKRDFNLSQGYLLSMRPVGKGGAPVTGDIWMEIQALIARIADNQWYDLGWDEGTQRYQAVLPPDIYYITIRNLPTGYYDTQQVFDLRKGDLSGDMSLNTSYEHPIPYNPPVAAKISVGPPDNLGEAVVSGLPGAALPLARVLLVNLNSTHQAHTVSEADGSFSTRIYAPPGSAIMVKHGPASYRWSDLEVGLSEGVNPFPGTIIHVPHTHEGNALNQPFAAAGVIENLIDDPNNTRNYVSSAWAITGTLGPVAVDGEWARVMAGNYNGQVVPGLYLGGLNWTHPALGDLDNDGDLDMLVGESSGHLVLYRNLGSSTTPNWQFETQDYANVYNEWWSYPALADVTGDGAPDLFVGAGNGQVQIYYNAGTLENPSWSDTPDVILNAGDSAAPALSDLDDDNDLDLLVGHQGGTIYYFKNTGTTTNPAWSAQTSSYGGISEPGHGLQPSFVDLDDDNDLDLLIGRSGDLVWYRNDGPPTNPSWTRVTDGYLSLGFSSAVSPATGDWDGDGDRDLVTGEHWGVRRYFRNDGPPAWTEKSYEHPFDLQGGSAPAFADWDNDGDQDMLIGQAHGNVHQFTNTGSATNPDWRPDGVLITLPWTNHPHPFPTFADIDGDNDYDLFIGEGGWQGPSAGGNIHYYRNDGTPSAPNWTLVSDSWLGLDVGGWSTPVFADIDSDNDLDLFIGEENGAITFLQNNGSSTTPSWGSPVRPYADLVLGSYSAPSFFDLDQDGDLDMMVGLENGSLGYVRNTGSSSNSTWELVSTSYPDIDVGQNATPVAVDLDGDGKDDLLIGSDDGGLHFYSYEGPGIPPTAGDAYAAGDLFQIEGSIRMYSPAIDGSTDVSGISAGGHLSLLMTHDQAGNPIAAENYFMSTLLTPTGFPIQSNVKSKLWLNKHFNIGNFHLLDNGSIGGSFSITGELPLDLPAGRYRPVIMLDFGGVPTSTTWLAANVTQYTYSGHEALLPPITVGDIETPRQNWRLLMDDFVQGTRGAGALEDRGSFEISSQIVSQGALFNTPRIDARSGQPITYRLEPFMPMISFTDRRMPAPPLIPFDLPGGQLCVSIEEPDSTTRNLGCEGFSQSFNRTKTTRGGNDLNGGTVQIEDVYSLKVASDRFRTTFDQYGKHTIRMQGTVEDIWGNSYEGGGTYEVWIADPIDIDPGVLPGTPLSVGDVFNPAVRLHPRVPASITITVTQYPDSDPAQAIVNTLTGQANPYGYFSQPTSQAPVVFTEPGEYRVDLTTAYTSTSGEVYMGSLTWGGVVMTPPHQADLIAHGRRGMDSLDYIPNHWFVNNRDLIISAGVISHILNPYFNGDILWSGPNFGQNVGDSLVMGSSVQDTVGTIEAAIQLRANRVYLNTSPPGDLAERFDKAEIPLFISTRSGRPAQMVPDEVDQVAYSYRTSQRPGVRVREVVAEDSQSGGYWRLDTLYDDQLGVGILGDQLNDYKFQYVGVVYRDLDTGHNEYVGQGSGWIFIPDDDPTQNRVMPPFAGPGNGGWTTEGGPILTLKGEDIHIFILPTGTRPGAILERGDIFHFAGHFMPTLDSQVTYTVTSPGGTEYTGGGQANSIGYFYDPEDDFSVEESGIWTVDVRVWHDGQCSGGATVPPYPSGDVLGSENGQYWFYVVPENMSDLNVSSPTPGFLFFENEVSPITISGSIPSGLNNPIIDYTISMPGFILDHGQVSPSGGTYQITFDPVALHEDFPNLDLIGRDEHRAGLSDTFSIDLLLQGQKGNGKVYMANTITLQGEQVFVGNRLFDLSQDIFLPIIQNGN